MSDRNRPQSPGSGRSFVSGPGGLGSGTQELVGHPCAQCGANTPPDMRVCPSCGALQPIRGAGPTNVLAQGSTVDLGATRLVVDARLGEGGMGVVWRAWLFHAPGTPEAGLPPTAVALKVLSPRLHGRAELRALFVHEAEAMRSLSHPNVVRFHALVDRPGELAIAMEYVDGDTLEDVVARQVARARLAAKGFAGALPGLPFARAWNYFQQLLGALAGTHALGLVHRDVKPSNVLVRRDGVVKLSDFGIAQLARGKTDPNLAAAGTAAYMSPEQVTEGPIDPRSDLYSAATVLFEMLAGRTPFDVQARGEILVRQDQVEAPPPPLRAFVPQAPPVLDMLFARALAKDPAQRFQTAIELGEAFRRALGLPESPEWHAQAELAQSATMPVQVRAEPARAHRMATLRDFLVERYRTVKIEQRGATPSP